LTELTVKTVAAIVGATQPYVNAALRCSPEQRAAVAAGDRPLVLPRARPVSPAVDWWRINDDALLAVINELELSTAVEAELAN
jgi:hypothetical protein